MTPNTVSISEEARLELLDAMSQHAPMNSPHEGYAVLLEEVDEFWEEVKHGTPRHARAEAIQVAAMAMRVVLDCYS